MNPQARTPCACCSRWLLAPLAGSVLVLALISSASAQPPAALTGEELEAEYAALARDVAHLEAEGNVLKRLVRLVTPTVVHIEATHTEVTQRNSRGRQIEETGSGVIVQIDGRCYALTNRHVVLDALVENIHIRFRDGSHLHPVKVWSDPETDVAVLDMGRDDLPSARIGDSRRTEIGDFVVALGSPFGLSHSVTYGIISAKGRRDLELGTSGVVYQDFIQTDAAINPGNSGGPLLNLRGEIVGINTAIASASGGNEGIGFAIPMNLVMFVSQQLVENDGRVERAFLGVRLDSQFDATAATAVGLSRLTGALVSGVTPESPAALCDLQVGDVIMQIDGVEIEDDDHLVNIVSITPIGEEITLTILRNGQTQELKATVCDRDGF